MITILNIVWFYNIFLSGNPQAESLGGFIRLLADKATVMTQ